MSDLIERVAQHLSVCGMERNCNYFAEQAIKAMREHFVKLGEDGSSCYDFAIQEIDDALSRS